MSGYLNILYFMTNTPSVIKRNYDFSFNINGLSIRTGGSIITGKEYVYVNGVLISEYKNRTPTGIHEFEIDGIQYRIEFEIITKSIKTLVCRLYCNNTLSKLFTATPQHPVWLGPLFGAVVFISLYINDTTSIHIPFYYYLLMILLVFFIDTLYAHTHIKIIELEV